MAIKVRHDGNAAAGASGAMSGGRAKRAMESATILGKPTQIQMTQGAHASAPGVSMAHVTNAPNSPMASATMASAGSSGVSSARFASPSSGSSSSSGGYSDGGDIKVTGSDRLSRPDNESVWNSETHQWVRRWLPGEKKAEEARRLADVQDAQWEYRFSQAQKIQQEQIRSDMTDIQSREDMTPKEKEYALQSLNAKLYGMKKMPYEIEREDEATRYQREKDQRDYELKRQANLDAKMASVFSYMSKPYTVKDVQTIDGKKVPYERTVIPDPDATWDKVQQMFGARPSNGANDEEKMRNFLAMFGSMRANGATPTPAPSPTATQQVQTPAPKSVATPAPQVVQQPPVVQQDTQSQAVNPAPQYAKGDPRNDKEFMKWYVERARPGTSIEQGYEQYNKMLEDEVAIQKDPRFRNDHAMSRFLGF